MNYKRLLNESRHLCNILFFHHISFWLFYDVSTISFSLLMYNFCDAAGSIFYSSKFRQISQQQPSYLCYVLNTFPYHYHVAIVSTIYSWFFCASLVWLMPKLSQKLLKCANDCNTLFVFQINNLGYTCCK